MKCCYKLPRGQANSSVPSHDAHDSETTSNGGSWRSLLPFAASLVAAGTDVSFPWTELPAYGGSKLYLRGAASLRDLVEGLSSPAGASGAANAADAADTASAYRILKRGNGFVLGVKDDGPPSDFRPLTPKRILEAAASSTATPGAGAIADAGLSSEPEGEDSFLELNAALDRQPPAPEIARLLLEVLQTGLTRNKRMRAGLAKKGIDVDLARALVAAQLKALARSRVAAATPRSTHVHRAPPRLQPGEIDDDGGDGGGGGVSGHWNETYPGLARRSPKYRPRSLAAMERGRDIKERERLIQLQKLERELKTARQVRPVLLFLLSNLSDVVATELNPAGLDTRVPKFSADRADFLSVAFLFQQLQMCAARCAALRRYRDPPPLFETLKLQPYLPQTPAAFLRPTPPKAPNYNIKNSPSSPQRSPSPPLDSGRFLEAMNAFIDPLDAAFEGRAGSPSPSPDTAFPSARASTKTKAHTRMAADVAMWQSPELMRTFTSTFQRHAPQLLGDWQAKGFGGGSGSERALKTILNSWSTAEEGRELVALEGGSLDREEFLRRSNVLHELQKELLQRSGATKVLGQELTVRERMLMRLALFRRQEVMVKKGLEAAASDAYEIPVLKRFKEKDAEARPRPLDEKAEYARQLEAARQLLRALAAKKRKRGGFASEVEIDDNLVYTDGDDEWSKTLQDLEKSKVALDDLDDDNEDDDDTQSVQSFVHSVSSADSTTSLNNSVNSLALSQQSQQQSQQSLVQSFVNSANSVNSVNSVNTVA